jgi:hypothetical protein
MTESNQLIEAAQYAHDKLSLVPAFGDGIGDKVSKAELGVALNKLKLALDSVEWSNLHVVITTPKLETEAIADCLGA